MAAHPSHPMAIQVGEAIVARLSLISHRKDQNKWWTAPTVIALGPPTMPKLGKPGYSLFVNLTRWTDTPIMGGMHEATADWEITCSVHKTKDPYREIHRLVYDVLKCLAEKETDRLDGLVVTIWPITYTASTEFVEQAGRGEATVLFRTLYRWTHGSP